MRLVELYQINESADPKKVLEAIKNECQPYISQINDMDGNRLRRGMTFNADVKKMNAVGDGRNETEDDVEWELFANKWLSKKFGFNARTEAVYCAGGVPMAKRYGLAYSIFPIGNFEFVWSPVVEDLYYPFKQSGGDINAVKEALETGQYTNQNLQAAVDAQRHEIMVHCPQGYYAVRDDVFDDWMWHYRPF